MRILTALLVLAAFSFPADGAPPKRKIDGVFVELQGKYDWYGVVKSPSVKEIVLTHLRGYDKKDYEKGCSNEDEAIAAIKETREGVKIYVGLVYDANFHVETTDFEAALEEDVKLARAFLAKLDDKSKKRVSGWYLAREWHNFNLPGTKYEEHLGNYLKCVSNHLPAVGEIVVAPFFVVKRTDSEALAMKACQELHDATATAAMFLNLVRDTKITRLLLQDGFGARGERACKWVKDEACYAKAADDYIKTISAAIKKDTTVPTVRFGIDLEAFGSLGPNHSRLDLQFAAVPKGAPVFVYEHTACCATQMCQ